MTEKWKRNAESQEKPRTVEQFLPLISKMARKFMARAIAIQSPLDEDDYKQELAATLLRCKASYDPDKGASFMNFFIQSGYRNLARMHRRDFMNAACAQTISLNQSINDDRQDIGDIISDGAASQDDLLLGEEFLRYIIAKVSDRTAHLIELLLKCPDILTKQFEAYHTGMDRVRDSGVALKRHRGFDLAFVCHLSGLKPKETKAVLREVESVVLQWRFIGDSNG